MALNVHIN